MNSRLKEILINNILQNIPGNIKPVNCLSEILDLGRESVYRRLNGQIDFTLAEIVKLSTELNFSLNEIHSEYDKNLAAFEYYRERAISPKQGFLVMLQAFYTKMQVVFEAEERYTDIALNRLITSFILQYRYLYKFAYYKWVHLFDKVPLNYYYKELELSKDVLDLTKKASYFQQRLDKTVVLDEYFLYNTIQEIKYYKDRDLIDEEETALIKNDLKKFIDDFQIILDTGQSRGGAKWEVYLCSKNISSNASCLNYDDKISSSFWIHSDSAINTSDKQIYMMQKEWINSLKKYSTLITQSNQMMQADFLNRQYRLVEDL